MDIDMEQVEFIIGELCEKYKLGKLEVSPVRITGGLMHAMYHVLTDRGEYAVKILNPDIMQRADALNNMIYSEKISNALKTKTDLIAAKELDGRHIIRYGAFYFMVFDWFEGKSIFADDITVKHCEQIGLALGKIHAADIYVDGLEREQGERELFQWDYLLNEAERQVAEEKQSAAEIQNSDWVTLFRENLPKLELWDGQVQHCLKESGKYQVISHRDLDPKNVMWKEDKPFLIDWEAAGYVNPFQELIEVINYWCVDSSGKYDRRKISMLMKGYTQYRSIDTVRWEEVLNCSYDGMLGWLAYNIKRALGLEGSKTEDRAEGRKQVTDTIAELNRYSERQEELREWLYTRSETEGKRC